MKEIHKLILAISKEATSIRNPLKPGINHQVYKRICKGLDSQPFQPAWALPYPELTDCIDLKMSNFPLARPSIRATTLTASIRKKALKDEISIERQIWVFLSSTRWAPAPPCHQGITWLELYVGYTQVGGQTRTLWEKDQANGHNQSKRQALARFIKLAKRVADTATEAHIRHMFRPSKEKARRLIPLGIVTHLGAITALPQWNQLVAEKVATQIIEMTHVRTAQHTLQLRDKTFQVCQKPVRLVGKALELAQ